jgi:hypothetical protein
MAFSAGPRARRIAAVAALAAMIVAVGVGVAYAQFGFGRRLTVNVARPDSFDGRFQFCRAFFRSGFGGDGGSWSTDYPNADINFSVRLSELTRTSVSKDQFGYPNHLVVQLTQDELYQCPFVMMLEVGSATFDATEAAALRDYLLKGGFLWVDDFWGSYAWDWWENQVRNVFPDVVEHPIIDLPPGHPLFSSQFEMDGVPQIPSINFFLNTGGTSERGMDSAEPHARAVLDDTGRIMMLMTHNTDISDSWEREGEDPRYFYNFGPKGYAFGVNVVLYALTH